ncbi:MAG TPA: hypothetical protein VN864_01495 [Thermoplasmata archaeon]|nr:hypothetical protein [Thermoplasmata archaeon]
MPRRARPPLGPITGLSLAIVGILLMAGGTALASPLSVSSAATHSHALAMPSASSALLAEARASAALGEGPGAELAPSAAPHPSTGPNVSFGIVMTFDAYDGYVVAVSLNDSSGPANNTYGPYQLTWEFSGGSWSVMNTTGHVPATYKPALVYDARDQYVMLYGGYLMDTGAWPAPLTNQTWSLRSGVWSNLSSVSTPAPFAVDFANMVYDAPDQYVLLYDEMGVSYGPLSETIETTWSYAAGTWTNLTTTAGTPPAFFGSMAYDALDGYVVYFGGYTLSDQLSNATFTFSGGAWTNATASVHGAPSARCYYQMAYDNGLGEVLLYGGLVQPFVYNASAYSTETWAYAAGNWTLLSSNGTAYNTQSMVYDPATNQTILLGSSNFNVAPPNVVTWILASGTWSIGAPTIAPSAPVTDAGLAFSLDVTQSPNAGGLSYEYSGLPSGCASVNAPHLTCVPADAGTYGIAVAITGADGFSATAQTSIEVNPPPDVLQFAPTTAVGEVGIAIGLDVNASSGSGGLTYSYLGLPTGCASANTAQLQCTPSAAGTYDITANVTDGVGFTASATTQLQVVPALTVTAVGLDRTALDVGQTVRIQTALGGGEGPYTYQYTGLPAGCATNDASSFSCAPVAEGAFAIGVQATDSLTAVAHGGVALVVNALPSVGSLEISSARILIGGSTELSTTILGGTAPFQYSYSGLPSGCAGTTGAVVACSAVPSGEYRVTVTVVDATGAVATESAYFSAQGHAVASPVSHTSPMFPAGLLAQAETFGFWWGLAVGTIAIALAGLVGGYRLQLARQGREIVRGVRSGLGDGPEDPPAEVAPDEGVVEPVR